MGEPLPPDPWWFKIPIWVWALLGIVAVMGILLLSFLIATQRYRQDDD